MRFSHKFQWMVHWINKLTKFKISIQKKNWQLNCSYLDRTFRFIFVKSYLWFIMQLCFRIIMELSRIDLIWYLLSVMQVKKDCCKNNICLVKFMYNFYNCVRLSQLFNVTNIYTPISLCLILITFNGKLYTNHDNGQS